MKGDMKIQRSVEAHAFAPVPMPRQVADEVHAVARELEVSAEAVVAEALMLWFIVHRGGWRSMEPARLN